MKYSADGVSFSDTQNSDGALMPYFVFDYTSEVQFHGQMSVRNPDPQARGLRTFSGYEKAPSGFQDIPSKADDYGGVFATSCTKPLVMRRITHIALAAVLAAMCVLPASGQSYKASKVREKSEPEPLSFSRIISTDKVLDSNLFKLTRGWDSAEGHVDNGVYFNAFDNNYMLFRGKFYDLNAKKENYDLLIYMRLYYLDPQTVRIIAYDIITFGDRHPVMHLSSTDDKLNRTWLWRVMHDKETVELQRKTAEECFIFVADSLEDFLRNGPKSESQILD